MAKTVRLRKCGEHPDCQLESLNDGPWTHTPRTRTLKERLEQRPDEDRLKRQLSKGIARVGELAQQLRDQHSKADQLLSRVELGTEGLPQVVALQAEAAATGERLAEGQLAMQALSLRLSHMTDNAAHLLDSVDARIREIHNAEHRIDQTVANSEETLSHIVEKIDRVESLLRHLEDRRVQFNKVDEVFAAVQQLRTSLKLESEAWEKQFNRLVFDLNREREERLASHAKTQRQLHGLAERLPDA